MKSPPPDEVSISDNEDNGDSFQPLAPPNQQPSTPPNHQPACHPPSQDLPLQGQPPKSSNQQPASHHITEDHTPSVKVGSRGA